VNSYRNGHHSRRPDGSGHEGPRAHRLEWQQAGG
jgi:hypothetical protein